MEVKTLSRSARWAGVSNNIPRRRGPRGTPDLDRSARSRRKPRTCEAVRLRCATTPQTVAGELKLRDGVWRARKIQGRKRSDNSKAPRSTHRDTNSHLRKIRVRGTPRRPTRAI